MEYNVYLDTFFLRVFFMNSIVLKSMLLILRMKCSWKRLFLASITGSFLNCMLLFYGRKFAGVSVVTAAVMCLILLGIERWKKVILYSFFLFFLAFCTEGAIGFSGSVFGAFIVPIMSWCLGKERKKKELHIRVILHFKGRKKELKGFLDSGNRLLEPLTGKMVHIASYDEIKDMLPECYRQAVEDYFKTGILEDTKVTKLQMYEFTFLSYHSIGKETGQLLGIRMDSAEFISSAGKKTEEKVLIGLTDQKLFVRGQDRMIMNGRLEL